MDDAEDIWHQASLLYIEDDEIDSMVVAKMFEANWRESPPYDSVRVDFTFNE
ncbi:hypothetical protein [Gracilimonas amylolytica]|uniref:hypothetical protein n=1 Tax=Gracilimonas amylolytica TaxID=1749045 RepID=UPI001E5A314E|nr:hypothetical protein [Gracilimonas amylolytica]